MIVPKIEKIRNNKDVFSNYLLIKMVKKKVTHI